MDIKNSSSKYIIIYLASDSRNPGPADYTVRKPLHHSGNVSAIT
jgi:hypothetical protein